MKQMLLRVFLLGMTIVLLTGCWDRRELNEVSVITGIAVDKGEDAKYRLTVEGLNSAELNPKTGGNAAPAVVFEQEGDSIAELSLQMNLGVTQHLIYSHLQTVVIGEATARDGMFEFLDFLERSREIRSDFTIVIASDATAADVLKVTYPVQKASSLKINTQLRTLTTDWGGNPSVRLRELIRALVSPGRDPAVAVVRIKGDPKKGRSTENMKKVDPDAMVVLGGLAVFRHKKYMGNLPASDIPLVMWMQGELKRTNVAVSCAPDRFLTAQVTSSNTSIDASDRGGRPRFHVRIEFEARLEGTECGDDLTKKETYSKYEAKLKQEVEERIADLVERLQHQYKADIIGFGEVLERQDYARFQKLKENWGEHFARAKIDVSVEAKLRRVGLVNTPFLSGKE
jgi:spore germination protein KC